MKNLISLSDYTLDEINEIYKIADELEQGKHSGDLAGKTAVMFFPSTSIRTRVTYEKGIYLLGGQSILFSTETLDKKEDLQDVVGYLNNWADLLIVRHSEIRIIETIAKYAKVPVINAMTALNHPCEILSDLYALSKIKGDITKYKFLFCGVDGNIGRAWKEASKTVGFELEQCCPVGYEIEGLTVYHDIETAIVGKDIVCTDSLPAAVIDDFKRCRVTKEVMEKANKGAILNPCPPFYRGEEVSQDVINSEYFAGYEFKKCLLYVQQAIMLYCLS
ncbi:MAG: peptide transporter [Clostridiales bacterium]|nr:peptide transporter [Clostridiales bacterium]